jgi:GTP cyclohydrolase II
MLRLWRWREIIDYKRPNNAKANVRAYNTQANNGDTVQAHKSQGT